MAELGTKHECYSCGAMVEIERGLLDAAAESAQAKRKRRDDVPKPIVEADDDLVVAPDEDIPDDEIEAPEGVVEEEEDFDDDEE